MPQEQPKLRPLNLHWVQWQGQEALSLQDPLRLGEDSLLVPRPLAPLLALLDGTRDLEGLRAGFLLRTGLYLQPSQVASFVETLDRAFLLDNQRFRHASQEALVNYRAAPHRAPALAGTGYPGQGPELLASLDAYCQQAPADGQGTPGPVVGLISPHIDYARGWRTYAATWQLVRGAVEEAELVILLGTDHSGSPGTLTLTRQNYATPWGSLPTDQDLVGRLAAILGEDHAYAQEVHHIGEHSVELASVWLHYLAGGQPRRMLPILCGGDEALRDGDGRDTSRVADALSLLAEVGTQQKTLVVAAGDLSHVGPAFGDSLPLDLLAKARIRTSDEKWLEAACSGSSQRLAEHLIRHGDATRICGAAPVRYLLEVLPRVRGRVVAYEQCPADEQFGSLVSIAGVVFSS